MHPNPFRSVWTSPRETIRQIVDGGSKRYLFLIPAVAGAVQAASSVLGDRADFQAVGIPLAAALVGALVVGALFGFVGLWLGSLLVYWVGKLLSGRATRLAVRVALTWGYVPVLAATVVTGVLGAVVGLLVADKVNPENVGSLSAVVPLMVGASVFMIITVVANVWATVITSKMVAEVQGFQSAWKGFLNLILPGLVIVVPIILILSSVVLVSLNSAREKAAGAVQAEQAGQVQQGIELELE